MASVDIRGVKEIKRAFQQLPKAIANKVVRKAIRAGLKPVRAAVKGNAPVDTGQTQRAVKVRAARGKRGTIRINVQIGEGDYKGETYYASFLEYGHFVGSRRLGSTRTWVPPVAFMQQAFKDAEETAKQITVEELKRGIDREVAALNKA